METIEERTREINKERPRKFGNEEKKKYVTIKKL